MIELQLIEKSRIAKHYSVLDFKQGENYYYIKTQLQLQDGSCLMVRWDNSPHHKEISTYPHHKHIRGTTESSREISLN